MVGGNMGGGMKPPATGGSPPFGGGMGIPGGGPKPLGGPTMDPMQPMPDMAPGQGVGSWVDAGFGDGGALNAQGLEWQSAPGGAPAPAAPAAPGLPAPMGGPTGAPGMVGGNMGRGTSNPGATRGMSPAASAERDILRRANMKPMQAPSSMGMAMPGAMPKPMGGPTRQPGAGGMQQRRKPSPQPAVPPKPGM